MSLAAFGGVFFFLNKNLAVLNMTWDMGYACLHSLAVPEKPSIITVHQHKSSTLRSGMMGSRGAAMPAKGSWSGSRRIQVQTVQSPSCDRSLYTLTATCFPKHMLFDWINL
jgi:hypothetical protein